MTSVKTSDGREVVLPAAFVSAFPRVRGCASLPVRDATIRRAVAFHAYHSADVPFRKRYPGPLQCDDLSLALEDFDAKLVIGLPISEVRELIRLALVLQYADLLQLCMIKTTAIIIGCPTIDALRELLVVKDDFDPGEDKAIFAKFEWMIWYGMNSERVVDRGRANGVAMARAVEVKAAAAARRGTGGARASTPVPHSVPAGSPHDASAARPPTRTLSDTTPAALTSTSASASAAVAAAYSGRQ